MKSEYDFSKGKRGAVLPAAKGKTRITICIDADILDWFRGEVDAAGIIRRSSIMPCASTLHASKNHLK